MTLKSNHRHIPQVIPSVTEIFLALVVRWLLFCILSRHLDVFCHIRGTCCIYIRHNALFMHISLILCNSYIKVTTMTTRDVYIRNDWVKSVVTFRWLLFLVVTFLTTGISFQAILWKIAYFINNTRWGTAPRKVGTTEADPEGCAARD